MMTVESENKGSAMHIKCNIELRYAMMTVESWSKVRTMLRKEQK